MMTKQQLERHEKLEQWLTDMSAVLVSYRFFITRYEFLDKRGTKRVGTEILGIDWNDYMMHPPAFPTAFVEYITNTVKGKTNEDGETQYKIGHGKLAPLYAAYKAYSERIATIDEILIDLEINPIND